MIGGPTAAAPHRHEHHDSLPLGALRRRSAPLLRGARQALPLPLERPAKQRLIGLHQPRQPRGSLVRQERQEAVAPAEGPIHRQPDRLGTGPDGHPLAQALGISHPFLLLPQPLHRCAGQGHEGLAAGLAAKALLPRRVAEADHRVTAAVGAGRWGAQALGDQAGTVGTLPQGLDPRRDLLPLLGGQAFQVSHPFLKGFGLHGASQASVQPTVYPVNRKTELSPTRNYS